VREQPPDLILSDVMMPQLDGFELLRVLRAEDALRDIPVILLSARAGEESRIDGLDAGADDYLVKPFSARELLARVGAMLERERFRRAALKHERTLRQEALTVSARLDLRTAQFETLLNEAPLGVYLVDADFRIREVNPTAHSVFGEIAGLIGRDFDEVMHILWPKRYADEVVQLFRHTLETGEPYKTAGRARKERV
jgi:CheY-like chemotaxis protein